MDSTLARVSFFFQDSSEPNSIRDGESAHRILPPDAEKTSDGLNNRSQIAAPPVHMYFILSTRTFLRLLDKEGQVLSGPYSITRKGMASPELPYTYPGYRSGGV